MIGEKPVDADYIQNFVLEFLGAWKTVSQEVPIQQNVSAEQNSATATVQPANPERAAVEKLIENYFKSIVSPLFLLGNFNYTC